MHYRLWTVCSAIILNRIITALNMMNLFDKLQYGIPIVVGAHIYMVQKESWLLVSLQMTAWMISWQWATKNPIL